MTDLIKVGPPDNHRLPNKSLGIIFFQRNEEVGPQSHCYGKNVHKIF
jgi:hypothetical protein